MKLDLNKPLTELDGSDQPVSLAKIAAQILKGSPVGNAIQVIDWALSLWRDGQIDASENELGDIKAIVSRAQFPAIARAQIIREIDSQISGQRFK